MEKRTPSQPPPQADIPNDLTSPVGAACPGPAPALSAGGPQFSMPGTITGAGSAGNTTMDSRSRSVRTLPRSCRPRTW